MSSATVEADAQVIEPPAELSRADEWLAGTRGRVASLLAEYGTHPIEDQAGYRDIRQSRTMLRREIEAIDAERRGATRAVEEAVARFRQEANEAVEPLREVERGYKAQLDEWDAGVIDRRREAMAAAYADMAPALAGGLCPFEVVWERRGRALKWQNRSTGEQRCMDSLTEVVRGIAADEQTIQSLDMTPAERDACRAEYFRTLDLAAAVRRVSDERDRLARIREMDEARRAQAASLEPRTVPLREAAPEPAPAPAPQAAPAPAPAPQGAPSPAAQAAPGAASRYVFEFECTPAQLSHLMAFLRAEGIHGKRRAA